MKNTKKKKALQLSNLQFSDPILLVWRDASGTGEWGDIHSLPDAPITIHQIGWYLKHDKQGIWLAQGLPLEDTCAILGASLIPMGCVDEVRKLKV